MWSVRILLVPVLLVALASGCSTATTYRRPATPAEAARILDKAGKDEVELVVEFPKGPEVRRGTLTPFDAHTFVLTEPSGQRSSVLFEQTRSISYGDTAKGATLGALIGALPAFLFGALIGSASSSPIEVGIQVGGIYGLLTGGIGAAIGASITRNRTITF